MGKNKKEEEPTKKIKVEDKEGLTLSYDKGELNDHFPHLIKEMSEKEKSIKIKSIENEVEQINDEKPQESKNLYPNELYSPRAIDFIRRCAKEEEAIDILDYLLKRNEISQEDYNSYRNIISKEGGLKKLINESGGPKKPGYYLEKYYFKDNKNQKLNSNED
ncbi:MAG: DUF2095 family protein [Promethearchaeota archaeon]